MWRPGQIGAAHRREREIRKLGAPLPEREETIIYNRFFGKDVNDRYLWGYQAELDRVIWRLRYLDRKQPRNFVVKTALAGLFLQTAQFAEAASYLESAFYLRTPTLIPVQSLLAQLYATVGETERSLKIIEEILAQPTLRNQPPALNNASHLAFLAGDMRLLGHVSRLTSESGNLNVAGLILETLRESGLEAHLPAHQHITLELLKPYQCWINVELYGEEGWPPMVSVQSFVALSPPERRVLERTIVESLADYYEQHGLPGGAYLGYFNVGLLTLPFMRLDKRAL